MNKVNNSVRVDQLVLLISATTVTSVYADDDSMYVKGLLLLCQWWK